MKNLQNTLEFKIANVFNNQALKMWHENGSFDGQVVFHMDLFDDWYCDTDPLEIVNSIASDFNTDKPHLLIDSNNIAYSLDDHEFIEHVFNVWRSLLNDYESFKN